MRLILLFNALLIMAVVFSWQHLNSTRQQFDLAKAHWGRCAAHAERIGECERQAAEFGFAADDYDCSRDVMQMVDSWKIPHGTIGMGIVKTNEDGFELKSINNPIQDCITMKQLVGFLSSVGKGKVRFFVDSVHLQVHGKTPAADQSEFWDVVELDLKYFSHVDP